MPVNIKEVDNKKATPKVNVRLVRARKVGEALGAIESNVLEAEDMFLNFMEPAKANGTPLVSPPYNLSQLELLVETNNALRPCIDAMETNIDGTGHEIALASGDEPTTAEEAMIDQLDSFFREPWPGESFVTLRRKLRVDLESIGNAYVEVLRNLKGEITFVRHVEGKSIRMVKLGEPIPTEVKVERNGSLQSITLMRRPRKFAQVAGNHLMFFKEYGESRPLHKRTGKFPEEAGGSDVEAPDQASEIIHFTLHLDTRTPYGIPRWVSQLPSILGSRKAEETNLEFFESGGIPPVMIMVQGGTLTEKAAEAIDTIMNRKKDSHKAAIVEIEASEGDLTKAGNVKVDVERFSSEQVSDSMFETYDDKSEKRVRRAFRLPPIFVGKSEDFNFATAFASYVVAEAQVFAPERQEFDERITLTLLAELAGNRDFIFRSKPLTVKDSSIQLEGIALARASNAIDGEQLIDALNDVTNLNLQFSADAQEQGQMMEALEAMAQQGPSDAPGAAQGGPDRPTPNEAPNVAEGVEKAVHGKKRQKKSDPAELLRMTNEMIAFAKMGPKYRGMDRFMTLATQIAKLSDDDRATFRTLVSARLYSGPVADPVGLGCLVEGSLDHTLLN